MFISPNKLFFQSQQKYSCPKYYKFQFEHGLDSSKVKPCIQLLSKLPQMYSVTS